MNRSELKPYVVFLLAGNYAQAEDFARTVLHGAQPFTYIDSEWHLRGLQHIHYVRCGQWRRRPDLPELEQMLMERRAIDVSGEFMEH